MADKIPLTKDDAEKLDLKPAGSDEKPEGGIEFAAKKDGDICYMSPCMNGQRYIYYLINGKCTLGYIQPC